MAVINSIRKRTGLLIGTIGVAMLLFVGGEFLGGSSSLINKQDTSVGEMDGEKIGYSEFESMVRSLVGGQTLSAEQMVSIREQAWNKFIQKKVLFKEYGSLGLSVAPEELFDQLKNNAQNKVLIQFFTNPQTNQIYEQFQEPGTGRLDNDKVLLYVKNIMNSEQKDSWIPIEEAIKLDALSEKYTSLIKEGLNATSVDAALKNIEDNQRVSISWTGMTYNDINDDEIQITETGIQAYYNKHKNESEYQQKETQRSAKIAVFKVAPSPEDFDNARNSLVNQIADFQDAENDTLFVFQNSDDPAKSFKSIGRFELPAELDSMVFVAPIDTVFGPYLLQNGFNISKKTGVKYVADSVNARHILLTLKPESDTLKTQLKADSLKAALERGADFESLAKEFSEDFGSAQKGGNLDWFTQGKMVPEFNDICFANNTKKGDFVIVTTQFGIHIINIIDKTIEKEKIQIANIVRYVEPSNETFDMVYSTSSAFSINNPTTTSFETALDADETIERFEYNTIKEADKTLGSIENPRSVIRWIYENELGKVSEPFELGNQFVVASITSIKEKGTLPLSEVRDLVKEKLINEKKAELILAKLGAFSTLEEAAQNIDKKTNQASNISFNMFSISGMGPENKVMGEAFAIPQGEISNPIVGENGVYVIKVDNIGEVSEVSDLTFIQSQITRDFSARVNIEVFDAIKENAGIVDNRSKFY